MPPPNVHMEDIPPVCSGAACCVQCIDIMIKTHQQTINIVHTCVRFCTPSVLFGACCPDLAPASCRRGRCHR